MLRCGTSRALSMSKTPTADEPATQTTKVTSKTTTMSSTPTMLPILTATNWAIQNSAQQTSAVKKPIASARHCVSPSPARVNAPKSMDL